ncbi:histidine kinase [Chitinophaga horti]|uniref:Histidine kinase n=1 Tax=Chitinophaga horti TaxID=2920382 RepID=A0ABY6J8F2_9BACT|nr:sensor histidine kinase [Chitinophaga horti]UYQ95975.1 histidine kinase [Chitinophaga horti]
MIVKPAAGQEFNYRHYNERDGLAGPVVYSMVQDKEGFMWFATETGVSRFDGTHFKNFTTADGLSNNEIIRLFCDSKGRVWLAPYKHSVCYYQNGYIHTQRNDSMLNKLYLNGYIVGIVENAQRQISIIDKSNLFQITPDDKVSYPTRFVMTGAGMVSMSISHTGRHYFMYRWGILEYKNNRFHHVFELPHSAMVSGVQCIMEDDMLGFIVRPNVYRIISTKYGLDYEMDVPALNTACRLNDSLILMNSVRGGEVFNIIRRKVVSTYLPNKNVSNVLRDREGNVWVATLNDGVYRISSDQFRNVLKTSGNNQKVSVYSLKKHGGQIHSGTDLGYFTLQPTEDGFSVEQDQFVRRPVTHMAAHNDLLMLSLGQSLVVKKGNRPPHTLTSYGPIKGLAIKNDREVIVAGPDGIHLMEIDKPNKIHAQLGHNAASALYYRNDSIYYGALTGLELLPKPGGDVFRFSDTSELLKGSVRAIKEGSGWIWVATDKGVTALLGNKIVRHLSKEDGLISNNVRCIEAHDSVLWIGTDKGLDHVVLSGRRTNVVHYTQADGLASDMVNSILLDGDRIYAGTQEGITYFDRHMGAPYSRCDLRLLMVRINGKKEDPANLPMLNYRNNNVHLEYAALSYKSEGDITYYYRLKEQDSSWKQIRQTSLDLISLPPGRYNLELYAVNRFGLQSATLTLPLAVEGPFWLNLWFMLLAAVLLIGLTWLFISWRLRILRKKETAEREVTRQLQELEQKALRAQMNPHFIFNCLNSVQEFIIDQDMESANRYLSRFARLIRQTLDMSMQHNITIQDEVRYLRTYLELEQMRFQQRFSFSISVDAGINVEEAMWPGMVLQPIVENAVHHGIRGLKEKEGQVTIVFKLAQRNIICMVTDNGVGRNATTRDRPSGHVSWGTRITRERISMMNKSISSSIGIKVNDLPDGQGTSVEVRYPLITGGTN